MEDETTESETPNEEEIVLTEEDDTSAGAKVAAALFTGAAVVGAYTIGKKAVVVTRGKFAAWKASRNTEATPPEPETPKSESEES